MSQTPKDIPWVNSLKAFCMLWVFINHSEIYYGCSSAWLGCFYRPVFVNCFFVVSGYLLFRKPWDGERVVQNSIFRLVIPTMIMCALFYVPKCLLRGQELRVADFLEATVGGGSIWFTMALAVAQLLLALLMLSRPKNGWTYAAFALALWGGAMWLFSHGVTFLGSTTMPWYYKSGMMTVPFLMVGGLMSRLEQKQLPRIFTDSRWLPLWVLIYGLLAYFAAPYCKTALDWQGLNICGFVVSVVGFFVLKQLLMLVPAISWIQWIGRHSIGFYFLCGAVVNVVAVALRHAVPAGGYGVTLLVALVSLAIAVPVVWGIDRFMPWMLDIRVLKRK